MRFSSWLRNQKGPGPGVRGHAPKMTRKRAMSRLRLEVLEDRWLPSMLTVTSPLDDGSSGTLRAVIAAASPGTEILFAKSVHTITLTGGQLVINKNLDIEGPGAVNLTVSGNNASRVFDITNNATVTIAGLTITDGAGR